MFARQHLPVRVFVRMEMFVRARIREAQVWTIFNIDVWDSLLTLTPHHHHYHQRFGDDRPGYRLQFAIKNSFAAHQTGFGFIKCDIKTGSCRRQAGLQAGSGGDVCHFCRCIPDRRTSRWCRQVGLQQARYW